MRRTNLCSFRESFSSTNSSECHEKEYCRVKSIYCWYQKGSATFFLRKTPRDTIIRFDNFSLTSKMFTRLTFFFFFCLIYFLNKRFLDRVRLFFFRFLFENYNSSCWVSKNDFSITQQHFLDDALLSFIKNTLQLVFFTARDIFFFSILYLSLKIYSFIYRYRLNITMCVIFATPCQEEFSLMSRLFFATLSRDAKAENFSLCFHEITSQFSLRCVMR